MPFGIIRESQRDSDPKPRVASRELPWEKRVVSANPNGVVARWRSGATTPLGLRIARTLTQGSLADSATLGWRTQSLWDCRRPKSEGRRPKEARSARISALGFPALRTAVETTDFTDNTDKGGIAGPGAFTSALTKPFPIRVIRVIRGFCIRPSGFGLLSAFGFPSRPLFFAQGIMSLSKANWTGAFRLFGHPRQGRFWHENCRP